MPRWGVKDSAEGGRAVLLDSSPKGETRNFRKKGGEEKIESDAFLLSFFFYNSRETNPPFSFPSGKIRFLHTLDILVPRTPIRGTTRLYFTETTDR